MTSMVVTYCKTNWMAVITPKCITKQTSSIFFLVTGSVDASVPVTLEFDHNETISFRPPMCKQTAGGIETGGANQAKYCIERRGRGEAREWSGPDNHTREREVGRVTADKVTCTTTTTLCRQEEEDVEGEEEDACL